MKKMLSCSAIRKIDLYISFIVYAFRAYVHWAKKTIDSFQIETEKFDTAINVMNKTDHFLMWRSQGTGVD